MKVTGETANYGLCQAVKQNQRIFWSLLPLIKRQDTPHPLKYYDNPLPTLYYICYVGFRNISELYWLYLTC